MIKPAAKGYRGWTVSGSVCLGKRGHVLGRWGAQATWRVHWARRLCWQQLGQYRNVTFGRLGRPQTWLACLQIRDDKVSPSHSEVCYEGQMNYLMLKKLKSIKGVFHYLIISRIRIGTRVKKIVLSQLHAHNQMGKKNSCKKYLQLKDKIIWPQSKTHNHTLSSLFHDCIHAF